MQTTVRFTLPFQASGMESGVLLESSGNDLCLHYDYRVEDTVHRSGLLFENVVSYSYIAHPFREKELSEHESGTLIELLDSNRIDELLSSSPDSPLTSSVLKHFYLFLQNTGCYEVISRSWEALPPREGSLLS